MSNSQTSQKSQETIAHAFSALTQNLQNTGTTLGSQMTTLRRIFATSPVHHKRQQLSEPPATFRHYIQYFEDSLKPIERVETDPTKASSSYNKHFDTPQPVSSMYTGREKLLEELKSVIIDGPSALSGQRRFVIHGLGGSGKTQFCSKFAEDNRERYVQTSFSRLYCLFIGLTCASFWGVFWIDCSTLERIRQSFALISKFAGVEPEASAAMHWLSSLEHRWLLIMDNADDCATQLQEHFPRGNRGHILITTRNEAHKVHGNVGPGYFTFDGLDPQEAVELLLKTIRHPQPYDSRYKQLACSITRKLGSLPLAVIHAGAAIRDGLCDMETYLQYYERCWKLLRANLKSNTQNDEFMQVHATWELCYKQIESKCQGGSQTAEDALQLLKIFSFFHYENIPFETFRRAIRHPFIEVERSTDNQNRLDEIQYGPTSKGLHGLNKSLFSRLFKSRSRPILPRVIHCGRNQEDYEVCETKVKLALRELTQVALITHNKANDSYSMHPIVHTWARERPGLRLREQKMWSEAAASLLACSFLLPPLKTALGDTYPRDVLPHVDHVRSCHERVDTIIAERLKGRWTFWAGPKPGMTQEHAIMTSIFSFAQIQAGNWASAEQLLSEVRSYLLTTVGPTHEMTRKVTLALADLFWNMGQKVKSQNLRGEVLTACLKSVGPGDVETLRVKDRLGDGMFQQGRYAEAHELLTEAFHGLMAKFGLQHEDTLNTMDNLARTINKFYNFCEPTDIDEAYRMHQEAVKGLERLEILGRGDHIRTLQAKEHLARAALLSGKKKELDTVENLYQKVVQGRTRFLGKDHDHTLLAKGYLAIAKIHFRKLDEAEELVVPAISAVERRHRDSYLGSLFGRHILAVLRMRQHRFAEAELILRHVTEKQRLFELRLGDRLPDRIGALVDLAICLRMQDKIEESVSFSDEALRFFDNISVTQHISAYNLKIARANMRRYLRGVKEGDIPDKYKGICNIHNFYSRRYMVVGTFRYLIT